MALFVALSFFSLIAYRHLIAKNRLNKMTDNVVDILQYARFMAITHHAMMTVCAKGVDDTHCGVNWKNGALVIDEKHRRVLRLLPAFSQAYRMGWSGTLGATQTVRWRSNGFTDGQQGRFFIEDTCASTGWVANIFILRTGRIRSELIRK